MNPTCGRELADSAGRHLGRYVMITSSSADVSIGRRVISTLPGCGPAKILHSSAQLIIPTYQSWLLKTRFCSLAADPFSASTIQITLQSSQPKPQSPKLVLNLCIPACHCAPVLASPAIHSPAFRCLFKKRWLPSSTWLWLRSSWPYLRR